ncbi:MAG: DUF1249 domain-containing protein [Pseudomonadota bacterium]|jgi:uncharacterized protein YqiB (DUF1249 family)|nr:DUF1249 domain-containing protein [Pseudomonadota bacterium]MDE3140374.1 DUF1249 domain-containing protein [Pseudomonadota bacterium]
MYLTAREISALLPGRFSMLMGLQAESFHRLERLFALRTRAAGIYMSDVGDGMNVHLDLRERHAYTLELELTYAFHDPDTGRRAPEAQIRMYTDAHLAEALHCHPGRGRWDVLNLRAPPPLILRHRLRMASFLSRWLEFLDAHGHAPQTLVAVPAHAPEPLRA